MKKILLCSIALAALAMVIACKAGEAKENKKLNDNESVQDERSEDNDMQDKETNDTDEAVKDTDENANSNDIPDTDSNDQKEGDEEQKGHPPNSYKDIDYDVKSIHE